MDNFLVDAVWVLPAAVVAIGSAVIALMAGRVAARAEALRASLVELPAVREPLGNTRTELHRVRAAVEGRHRR
jgi:alkylation response protein AidB-like acyl-CoA dehydrogenase